LLEGVGEVEKVKLAEGEEGIERTKKIIGVKRVGGRGDTGQREDKSRKAQPKNTRLQCKTSPSQIKYRHQLEYMYKQVTAEPPLTRNCSAKQGFFDDPPEVSRPRQATAQPSHKPEYQTVPEQKNTIPTSTPYFWFSGRSELHAS
jgi:hypothetical protein